MMISRKIRSQRGEAMLVALLIGTIVTFVVFAMLGRSRSTNQLLQKSAQATVQLMSGHGVAALLKQEFVTNYNTFVAGTGGWAACTGGGTSVTNFLTALDNPSSAGTGCGNVAFVFSYFKTAGSTPSSDILLSAFKGSSVNLALPASMPDASNRQQITVRFDRFNADSSRNLVVGTLSVDPPQGGPGTLTSLPNTQNLKLAIDVARTIASPSGSDASCHLCRTIPGSVCCGTGSGGTARFTYLETGDGRLIDATYDSTAQTFTVSVNSTSPDILAVTVKNLSSLPTYFHKDSFCISSIQSDPLAYVVDAAQATGRNYYLTDGGDILDENASVVASDPKLLSIAYDDDNSVWYLLRTDGQVLSTNALNNPASWTPIPGLVFPTAVSLCIGQAPPAC